MHKWLIVLTLVLASIFGYQNPRPVETSTIGETLVEPGLQVLSPQAVAIMEPALASLLEEKYDLPQTLAVLERVHGSSPNTNSDAVLRDISVLLRWQRKPEQVKELEQLLAAYYAYRQEESALVASTGCRLSVIDTQVVLSQLVELQDRTFGEETAAELFKYYRQLFQTEEAAGALASYIRSRSKRPNCIPEEPEHIQALRTNI